MTSHHERNIELNVYFNAHNMYFSIISLKLVVTLTC